MEPGEGRMVLCLFSMREWFLWEFESLRPVLLTDTYPRIGALLFFQDLGPGVSTLGIT